MIVMKKIFWGRSLLVAGILVVGINVQAQTSQNSDIQRFNADLSYTQVFKENVQIAVKEHPRTSAALAARDEHRFQQQEARAALYPQIGVDLSGRHRIADNFEDRFDNITQRSLRDTAANISLIGRQLLFDGGSTSSRIASARHAFTASHEEYSYEASAVALAAVEAHYYVLYETLRRELHRENVERHSELLEMVQLRFESGRGPNRDVTLMESRLAIAETNEARSQMDLEGAISHYEEVYSFSPATDLERPVIAMEIPVSENAALETGFQYNPLLVMASSRSLSSLEEMNAERATQLPQVSLELAATKYDLERGNRDYDITGRLVMSYDLYTGGARSARIGRSARGYDRARHSEDNIRREVNRTIKVAFQTVESHVKQLASLEKAMNASQINRDQTREQFEATGGSLFNLLEAEREHHSAREQHLGGIVEKDLSEYRLLDAMGTLLPALNVILQREG